MKKYFEQLMNACVIKNHQDNRNNGLIYTITMSKTLAYTAGIINNKDVVFNSGDTSIFTSEFRTILLENDVKNNKWSCQDTGFDLVFSFDKDTKEEIESIFVLYKLVYL